MRDNESCAITSTLRYEKRSLSPSVIAVRRAGRCSASGDLRLGGVLPLQWGGEGNASAGNLCTGRVRKSERRGNGNSGVAKPGDGVHNRCLAMRTAANRNSLAVAKASRADDRNHGRSHSGGGTDRGCSCRANLRDDGRLAVRSGINPDRLTHFKAKHAGYLYIRRAGGLSGRQRGRGRRQKIGAVAIGVEAIRETACACIGSGR